MSHIYRGLVICIPSACTLIQTRKPRGCLGLAALFTAFGHPIPFSCVNRSVADVQLNDLCYSMERGMNGPPFAWPEAREVAVFANRPRHLGSTPATLSPTCSASGAPRKLYLQTKPPNATHFYSQASAAIPNRPYKNKPSIVN